MQTKTSIQSLIVFTPPLTDVPELIGAYKTVMGALNINTKNIPFPLIETFTHPIPETDLSLKQELTDNMSVMVSMVANCHEISVHDVHVSPTAITFNFLLTLNE